MKWHPRCRPPAKTFDTRRWDNGRWRKDNGNPGVVFVGLLKPDAEDALVDEPTIWIADCDCKNFQKCPLSKALAYAADKYGGSATVVRCKAVK